MHATADKVREAISRKIACTATAQIRYGSTFPVGWELWPTGLWYLLANTEFGKFIVWSGAFA